MKKIKFNNGTVPALSAENMNELQDNIEVEINKNSNDINNMESNAYFIGYFSQNLEVNPTLSERIHLNPDKIMLRNITFENDILTIGEDGLYYVSGYIHHKGGIRRSFFDVGITDGGPFSPTVIRSQDTQNMWYVKNDPASGDPCYELNRPVFLKKGAKLDFAFWTEIETVITGSESFDTMASCISVIKIGNYPSEVSNENN